MSKGLCREQKRKLLRKTIPVPKFWLTISKKLFDFVFSLSNKRTCFFCFFNMPTISATQTSKIDLKSSQRTSYLRDKITSSSHLNPTLRFKSMIPKVCFIPWKCCWRRRTNATCWLLLSINPRLVAWVNRFVLVVCSHAHMFKYQDWRWQLLHQWASVPWHDIRGRKTRKMTQPDRV